ncbi:hypothetical protein [Larkinella sp.]|uniref:hypothetical protein n=1 Tax=Larkinella sp. TaxID=2034517 RepID=UPI003BAC54C8
MINHVENQIGGDYKTAEDTAGGVTGNNKKRNGMSRQKPGSLKAGGVKEVFAWDFEFIRFNK